ncbi:MAG: aminoacyl-tRNA hydrolase [Deltaproteobacteria bacterium]|nr:aminoacyl-tRNA hydrolase [Deltaproteobacteria bacterium]
MDRWLLAGLGNPGNEHAATRHNVGFRVLDELAVRWRIGIERRQFGADLGTGQVAGEQVVMIRPRSYMNLSGRAIAPAASLFGIGPDHLLVLHDDIDLPVGVLRVKEGGGDGGHRGLRSITQSLGSNEYLRVRIGVGRPAPGEDAVEHVLGSFSPEEQQLIEPAIRRAADAAEEILRRGVPTAMNYFNCPTPAAVPPAEKP